MIKKLLNNIYSIIKRIKEEILDLIFPKFCVGCGLDGELLCQKCTLKIVPVMTPVCPECGRLSESGQYCFKCKPKKALKGVISAAYYEEGPIREMVHNLKYNSVTELAEPLAELMADALRANFEFLISNFQSKSNDLIFKNLNIKNSLKIQNSELIIVFVPLHWFRQTQRGYNQSELLARAIGNKLNLPVYNLLRKRKKTKRQVELTGKLRRENLKGVFVLNSLISLIAQTSLKGKTILLVDDIFTTGSTLNECARVLKTAGVKEIWGLVVARG